jgi:hypothetical protein
VFGLFLIALKTVHVGVFPCRTVKKNMRPEFSTAIAAMYNGLGISGAKKKEHFRLLQPCSQWLKL